MNYEALKEIFQARRTLFLALALLALVDAGVYAYSALWQEPRLKQAQQSSLEAPKGGSNSALKARAERYHNGKRDLALFDQHVIAKKDFARFLAQLFDGARKNNLTLKGITYKPTPLKDQGMVAYSMNLAISGRYPALKSFIAELCRDPQMVAVDSISLTSSSRTQESVELTLQLTAFLKTEGA